MPIYEYECSEHGRHEVIQRRRHRFDPCPECGDPAPWVLSRSSFKMSASASDHMAYLSTPNADPADYNIVEDDSDGFWDGWPDKMREGFDRPNPLYYESDKVQVDLGDRE